MTLCEWNGHKFETDSNVVRSFSGLQLSAEVETSDKAKDKYGYIERKKTKPVSVSMTALLYTITGCDPQGESETFLDEAAEGAQDYLYIGGEKLFTCQMMLTKATVSSIEINGSGQWVSCEVQLTFTQSTLFDGKTVKKTTKTQTGGQKKKSTFLGFETGTTTKENVVQKTG